MSSETTLFSDKASLLQFTASGWTPIGTSTSTIWLLEHPDTSISRIVARDDVTQQFSMNQAISGDMTFQKANETFVQWRCSSDQSVWGLTFTLQTSATQFTDALTKVVNRLNGTTSTGPSSIPPPIDSAASSTPQQPSQATKPTSSTSRPSSEKAGRPISDKKDKKEKEKEKDKDKKDKKDKHKSIPPASIPQPISAAPSLPSILETPEEAEARAKREFRFKIASELCSTEEHYFKMLNDIIYVWLRPMKSKSVITDQETSTIFANIEALAGLHPSISHELKMRVDSWSETTKIGDIFQRNIPYMRIYKQYFDAHEESVTFIKTQLLKRKSYISFAKSAEASSTGGLGLLDLLASPMARVPRYLVMLSELLKKTGSDHPDYKDLEDAVAGLESICADLKKSMSDATFAKRLQSVISRNYTGLTPLLIPHRLLHMEAEIECHLGGDRRSNIVLLFNDCIAFVLDTPKDKRVLMHLAFDTLWTLEVPEVPNTFELATPETTYRCICKDSSSAQYLNEIDQMITACLTQKGSIKQADSTVKASERIRTATFNFEAGGSYSGEWAAAKPNGTGKRTSSNGSVFEGSFVKGFFHGTGVATYRNGDVYTGEWCRDVPHGNGTLSIKTSLGVKQYVGGWESGRKKGQGKMVWENGDTYEGQWEGDRFHGQGTITKQDGTRYEGEWAHGLRSGAHGVFIGPLGERYEGAWLNGQRHGKGTFTGADGSTYTGDWMHDQKHGSGIYVPFQGLKYEGEFKKDLFDGQGTLTETSGDVYSGSWRAGKRFGQGTMTRPNGERYEGAWCDNQKQGKGIWTNGHGTVYDGEFKEDRRSGQGTLTRPDSSSYSGGWLSDRRDGRGIEKWPNGASYDGFWKGDLKHGDGTFTWTDGSIYTGTWEFGKRNGSGIFKCSAGAYQGNWKDDNRDGIGTWTFPDGTAYAGEWTADRRNGKGILIVGPQQTEQIWKDGLIVKPGTQHYAPDLPGPYYF